MIIDKKYIIKFILNKLIENIIILINTKSIKDSKIISRDKIFFFKNKNIKQKFKITKIINTFINFSITKIV